MDERSYCRRSHYSRLIRMEMNIYSQYNRELWCNFDSSHREIQRLSSWVFQHQVSAPNCHWISSLAILANDEKVLHDVQLSISHWPGPFQKVQHRQPKQIHVQSQKLFDSRVHGSDVQRTCPDPHTLVLWEYCNVHYKRVSNQMCEFHKFHTSNFSRQLPMSRRPKVELLRHDIGTWFSQWDWNAQRMNLKSLETLPMRCKTPPYHMEWESQEIPLFPSASLCKVLRTCSSEHPSRTCLFQSPRWRATFHPLYFAARKLLHCSRTRWHSLPHKVQQHQLNVGSKVVKLNWVKIRNVPILSVDNFTSNNTNFHAHVEIIWVQLNALFLISFKKVFVQCRQQ